MEQIMYAHSDDAETYAVGFVVRKEDKDAEWATGLAKAVQCDAHCRLLRRQRKRERWFQCGS